MRNGSVLGAVLLAAAVVVLLGPSRPARADNVVADDQIVQGNLCVGTPCVNGQVFFFSGGEILVKGTVPHIEFEDTDGAHVWEIVGPSSTFAIQDATAGTVPVQIFAGAPFSSFTIAANGKVGVGTISPSQPLHVRKDQNANTFFLVQNAMNDLNANAVVRTQADIAQQNFQSHASSRTITRWGTPLGGWNEFLSVVGNGLAMGTLGDAPFILGTSSVGRMRLDGASNVIDFAGGGQYNGANFLDASSRERKQDIKALDLAAAMDALASLAPVTLAYRDTPDDSRVGFIAEDVPALVARPGRATLSALEIVAVLTKVVQEQQAAMREQRRVAAVHERLLEEQEKVVHEQRKALEAQQQAIAELVARVRALEPRR